MAVLEILLGSSRSEQPAPPRSLGAATSINLISGPRSPPERPNNHRDSGTSTCGRGIEPEPADSPFADDILRGLEEIANFIDETPHRTAALIRRREIPAGRLGNEYIASKQRLRRHYQDLTAGLVNDRASSGLIRSHGTFIDPANRCSTSSIAMSKAYPGTSRPR